MTAHLRLVEVTKHFGPTVAVDRVSLEIEEGSFFTLLGPSGCGKTTLLRVVAGFHLPDRGEVAAQDELDGFHYVGVEGTRRGGHGDAHAHLVPLHGYVVDETQVHDVDAQLRVQYLPKDIPRLPLQDAGRARGGLGGGDLRPPGAGVFGWPRHELPTP